MGDASSYNRSFPCMEDTYPYAIKTQLKRKPWTVSLWDISTDLDQYECFSLINNLPVKLTRVLLGDALRGHHDERGLHTRQTEGDQPVRNKQRRRKREGEFRNGIEIIIKSLLRKYFYQFNICVYITHQMCQKFNQDKAIYTDSICIITIVCFIPMSMLGFWMEQFNRNRERKPSMNKTLASCSYTGV